MSDEIQSTLDETFSDASEGAFQIMSDEIQSTLDETYHALRGILLSGISLKAAVASINEAVENEDLDALHAAIEELNAAHAEVFESQRQTLDAVMNLQVEVAVSEGSAMALLDDEYRRGFRDGMHYGGGVEEE
jgi:uncharacterized iron-regulated protein